MECSTIMYVCFHVEHSDMSSSLPSTKVIGEVSVSRRVKSQGHCMTTDVPDPLSLGHKYDISGDNITLRKGNMLLLLNKFLYFFFKNIQRISFIKDVI